MSIHIHCRHYDLRLDYQHLYSSLESLFQKSRYPDIVIVLAAMNGCNQKQLLPLAVPHHPLYTLLPNYDDKWDTIEYRSTYDLYICSVFDTVHLLFFDKNSSLPFLAFSFAHCKYMGRRYYDILSCLIYHRNLVAICTVDGWVQPLVAAVFDYRHS